MIDPRAHDWDRLPEESPKAYQAFRFYLEMGPTRTINGAHQGPNRGPNGTKRAPGRFKEDAKRLRWAERAKAYDAWLASREIEAQAKVHVAEAVSRAKRREQVDDQAWVIAQQLKLRGLQMLQWPLDTEAVTVKDGKTTIIKTPARWSQRDAVRFLAMGDMIARLATGMPPRGIPSEPARLNIDESEVAQPMPPGLAAKINELAATEALKAQGIDDAQPDDFDS